MLPLDHLRHRRSQLLERISSPVLLMAGGLRSRNYPDNYFAHRTDSHFLFFFGPAEPGSAALFDPEDGTVTLFLPERTLDAAVWTGPVPSFEEMRERTGVDFVLPIDSLDARVADRVGRRPLQSIAVADAAATDVAARLSAYPLDFDDPERFGPGTLIDVMAELRLTKLEPEIDEMRTAVSVAEEAFAATMAATAPGVSEQFLAGVVTGAYARRGAVAGFETILSVRGQVLHNHDHDGTLADGDLLLVDSGAEIGSGWTCDVARTWPANGRFASEQRDVYEIVLAANEAGIAACTPGTPWRDVHFACARVIAAGLVDLGVMRGDPDDLVARGAHALFFPHGVGHFLGLDAHDLEPYGDRIVYDPRRPRSTDFGTAYLRVDLDLQPGMIVTVEPGIYFVPEIFAHPELSERFADCLVRDRIEEFLSTNHGRGFGGIRTEDDIVVRATAPENLTAAIPKSVAAVEAAVGASPASA